MGRKPAPFFRLLLSAPEIQPPRRTSFTNIATGHPARHQQPMRVAAGCPSMMDFILEAWVSSLIELNKLEWMLGASQPWKSEDIEAQAAVSPDTTERATPAPTCAWRKIAAASAPNPRCPQNLDLSVMTQNFDLTRGYFGDAKQVHLPDVLSAFFCIPKCVRMMEWWRAKARCSRANSRTRSQR